MQNLDDLKNQVRLINYIPYKTGSELISAGRNTYRINPCPVCGGNDHFTIYDDTNTYSSFNDCCRGGSIIDFLEEYEGYEQSDAIKELYNITGNQYTQDTKTNKTTKEDTNTFIREQKKQFILDSLANQTAENKQQVYEYLATRGISQEIADKYHLFISTNVYEDKALGSEGTPRLVVPIYKNNEPVSYVARAIVPVNKDNQKVLNSAGEQTPLNIDYIAQTPTEDKLIYICEGWADALSIEDSGKKAIAIHSTSNINKLMQSIKNHERTSTQYTYILCLDNDSAGKKATQNLVEEMNNLNIKHQQLKIPDYYKDINEWYQNDKNSFVNGLNPFFNDNALNYINTQFLEEVSQVAEYKSRRTGFPNLDAKLNGIYPSLYVIGAISSMGKTTFVHQIADQMASDGEHILYFSLEQSRLELTSKSISRETFKLNPSHAETSLYIMQNKNMSNIRKDAIEKHKKYAGNIHIIEANFNITVTHIRNYVENYINITGIRPVVVIDYLQILRPVNDRWSEKQQVDFNVSELKRLSANNKIPVFVISSFNRESYASMADFTAFKESGGIEYGADVVIALQLQILNDLEGNKDSKKEQIHQAKSESPREIELLILKNRNGVSFGRCGFNYIPEFNYFEDTGEVISRAEISKHSSRLDSQKARFASRQTVRF